MFAKIFLGLLCKLFVGGRLSVMEFDQLRPIAGHSPWHSFPSVLSASSAVEFRLRLRPR